MSNKLTQAVLPLILLFSSGGWADMTLSVTISPWSTDSVYGDNTVYETTLVAGVQFAQISKTSARGGIYLEPFPKTPSLGDNRCLDDACNYYLDISEIMLSVRQRSGSHTTYSGPWEDGGYKGMEAGGSGGVVNHWQKIDVLPSSKLKIKKRNTGLVSIPSEEKIVTIRFKQCDSGQGGFNPETCNSLDNNYSGIKGILNIIVPPPTLPKVQCYMSPWSNSIDFQPVTVPAEKSKAGQATWPLSGGGFTGVEAQSASLSVNCNNIDAGITSFPLTVGLSGTNWEYGQNSELYFNAERSIAVAANLKMEATGNGTLSLDTVRNAACQNYWSPSGANAFEMGPARLGQYLSAKESACQFTHTLPTARNIVEGFRFTLNAILGVSTQPLAAEPGYGEHTGALMLEVNSL